MAPARVRRCNSLASGLTPPSQEMDDVLHRRALTDPARVAARALAIGAALIALPSAALAAPEQSDRGAPPAAAPISSRIVVEWNADATSAERADGRDVADTNLVRTLG